jgi:4-amino-4-deoxy-L-arabinose transferase-like glycosyltransferase
MADRSEWREAADLQPATLWLAVTLVVAAALRFWHLGAGLPYLTGIDEPEIMVRVVAMMKTGDFNPHFFDYPGLIFALHLPVAVLNYLVGAARGHWHSLSEVGPSDFYLWARAVTAAIGVATVFVTHQIGMRWGARHALLAAGLMALMPLHVRESHYALTDVPVTFLVALTGLAALKAHEERHMKAFALAGFVAGLATATKYNAGVALLLPLIAAWFTHPIRPSRLAAVAGTVLAWVAGFLVAAPFTLIDLPGFLDGFGYLMRSFTPRAGGEPGWLIYLKHLQRAFGWPSMILLLVGALMGVTRIVKGPGRPRWAMIVVFPILYFWILADRSLIYARYLLPLLPFTCVLAAVAVISGVSMLRRFNIPRWARTLLIVALTVAVLLPPALSSLSFVRNHGAPTTQELAYRWFEQHVPRGATVAIERRALALPEQHYRVSYPRWLVEVTGPEAADGEAVGGPARYLVASSEVYESAVRSPRGRELSARYGELFARTREVARFAPGSGRRGPVLRVLEVQGDPGGGD